MPALSTGTARGLTPARLSEVAERHRVGVAGPAQAEAPAARGRNVVDLAPETLADVRGSAEFKRSVVRVYTERGLRQAIAEAQAGREGE
jgi:CO/xanthine dehydrogenase FAD-binding subunit